MDKIRKAFIIPQDKEGIDIHENITVKNLDFDLSRNGNPEAEKRILREELRDCFERILEKKVEIRFDLELENNTTIPGEEQ